MKDKKKRTPGSLANERGNAYFRLHNQQEINLSKGILDKCY